ncbi:hypothetical protein H9I32_02640 [Bacillus sp. Xin]|uniref:hypothetical protein n=1 Tax=unclassified Bacillus (in: firmicutes) TaxID=185979 RepID=UPI001574B7B1|nr:MULTISPECIES: hypothetical protein [unclassified Bacillus (in: firmicutes)]MBC6971358.1 hypothetical protein [Bacillus sp. Xin]NSW35847.1 hypothetical protein [Bacillus sp. Xin1]
MDIKKMIEMIKVTEVDTELLVSKIHKNLINLYNKKDMGDYTEMLHDMFVLAVHLEFDFVLKYFGAKPIVTADERIQFQEIFKCLATRNNNKDWFLHLFSLFLGIAIVFKFDTSEIEREFFEKQLI